MSAEEIAEFQRRQRQSGRHGEQPERHWRREPATYSIRFEERTDIYGRQRSDESMLQIAALRPSVTASSDEGSVSGKVKRTVLEMNERARKAQTEMPAPQSRKDSEGGSKGAQSSKGNTGFKGKGTKANIDADADSESERPSGSGTTVPGPPLDSDDDHD